MYIVISPKQGLTMKMQLAEKLYKWYKWKKETLIPGHLNKHSLLIKTGYVTITCCQERNSEGSKKERQCAEKNGYSVDNRRKQKED